MVRLILAPVLAVVLLVTGAAVGLISFFSHVPMHQLSAHANDTAGVAAHRHLAACYRDGCRDILRSPVLGCAWRLVVVVETAEAADDVAAAKADCGILSEGDRRKAEEAKERLLHQRVGRASKV
jgi:hypothetical protein